VTHGPELQAFAEAVLGGRSETLAATRQMLKALLDEDAFLDACGVIAFFNAINRVADATGTKLIEED
jgi:alkylhydroperoxidase family enzyme